MKEVYRARTVVDLQDALGGSISTYDEALSVKDYISQVADHVWFRYQADDDRLRPFFNNYHPKYISKSWSDIRAAGVSTDDVLDAAAYYFSYKGMDSVPDIAMDINFEKAVDILLAGDQEGMRRLLDEDPLLLTKRSHFGHRAYLWHYLGSNGVELHRQVVPSNIVEMILFFLDRGMPLAATFMVYGGEHSLYDMISTSCHPKEAGVQEACLQLLDNYKKGA